MPALAIGAACGILTAWLLQYGVANWGARGSLPGLLVIVVAIFLQLRGKVPIAINRAYMLYLTVMAAPLVQANERFADIVLVTLVATIYFGGVVVIGRRVLSRYGR